MTDNHDEGVRPGSLGALIGVVVTLALAHSLIHWWSWLVSP